VLRSIEASLNRLCLDHIDVVYIHDPDEHYDQVIRETYPTLHRLREEGVISAVGVGMNQPEMLVAFARQCQFDCFLLAGRYTLLDQSGMEELFPLCVEKQISIVIGGPFNSGVLATGAKAGAKFNYQDAPQQILKSVERIERRCLQYNIPLKAAALQFILANPAVAATIPGCRSPEEIEENSQLIRLPIPGEFWSDLTTDGLIPQDAPTPVSND
jgi:D-threo-aldose 1-dehydrogenase